MANTAPTTAESSGTRSATLGTGTLGTGTLGSGSHTKRRKRLRKILLFLVIGIVLAVAGVLLYRYFASYESTDDAEIDGYIYPVSSRVPGYVVRVTVDNNQYVPAGTVLAQLDPKDYRRGRRQCQGHLGERPIRL